MSTATAFRALPPDWHRGAFMEIFVRRYADGNGDGIGDLPGLTERLDHLHELGIRGLWLMPIHPSQDGDHGYAVTDYRAVHPDYGTLADFDHLLHAAHARGIGVIIDYVINHSANAHPLFQASRSSRASPVRDWYVWADPHPSGWRIYDADPWRRDDSGSYFAAFSAHMPDFNWRNPAVEAWHHDNLRFWLDRGVDGFRFDAVGHLVENGPDAWDCQPENLPIMARIRALLDGYGNRFMVNEVPGAPALFAQHAGSAFGFDINGHVVAAARGEIEALHRVARHFETAPPSLSTLLSNHDSFAGARVADQLDGDLARLRLAAALLILLPGTPFLYYGEEIGHRAAPGMTGDRALRTPMPWSGLGPDALALRRSYGELLALRHARPSITHGRYTVQRLDGPLFGFSRVHDGETTQVLVNASAAPACGLGGYGVRVACAAAGPLLSLNA